MFEPEKKDNPNNLEDTVRNLREENAKLLQLLRSQGLLFDPPPPPPIIDEKTDESSNIIFDHSDVTLTTNSINTTNQITHQHVNNHGPINQQNYSSQIIHGNQSNISPNFNTVIQTASQPFVQNNSNTLVQNNTNLIQPINLVNFNNVNIDSLQSFFASQNNLVYLSPSSSSSSSTTTTTTTTTTSNINVNESEQQHQISIRPKPSVIPQNQELVPVLPKIKTEQYDNASRQLSSSSNSETTNLLDNDLNHKQPRAIRPKPSSRSNSLQVYTPVALNETKPVLTPSSLINNTSSTVSLLSPPASFDEHHPDLSPQLIQSKSMELSVPPTKKSNTNRIRNRKKTPTLSPTIPSNNPPLVSIAPNLGRPLAPAPLNVQRIVTTNKRSIANKKRTSKSLLQCHSESILQANSSPSNSFAESISGLMQNFDQELIASNFLSQPATTTNILSDNTSNVNLIRELDNLDVRQIVNRTIQRTESYQSMPTFEEFNDRLETETNQTMQDYNNDNEQITSFMNEDDMNFVEMNFDENTFLKQFDLEDAGIKLNVNSDQNIFASLLTNNHLLNHSIEQSNLPPLPPPHPIYPGSSLINNNVFTTVVPLGLRQQSSQNNSFKNNNNTSRCLPEEGVQLTARHLEPSQVATYESAKYQDILDDLVTVTDQDVLSHVQAAAAAAATSDTTVISTDFSFALLEATNEIIKTTQIPGAEETASAFVDLQYFYPIEQEQEFLQKQLEECQEEKVLDEKFETEILPSAESPKATITDLSSIIQIDQTHSKSPIQEITPSIDYDSLLPPPPPPPSIDNPRKPCILFEPILSPIKSSENEMIIDSGCLNDSSLKTTDQIKELINDTTTSEYEIIENQGHTSPSTNLTVDNLDHLIEQIEQPTEKILEKNFFHYQKMYNDNLKKKPQEQYSPIPSVKLKLHSIFPKHKKKRKCMSPVLICEALRPPLRIKIRTKLPSPLPKDEPPILTIKIRKPIKKAKRKKSAATIDDRLEREAKLSLKTEYAGLTRFEQPLAQLYHQEYALDTRIPPTPGENDDLTNLSNAINEQDLSATIENLKSPLLNHNRKYSHLLNYADEQLNNNTYITPPPEIDLNTQQQQNPNDYYQSSKKIKKHNQNPLIDKEYYPSSRKTHHQPPAPPPIHIDPYTQSYHHFNSQPAPFFNFPFPNPFINPPAAPHFHHNSMKYTHPAHTYSTHQQQYNYHPHLQRQQQYNSSNYMSSHDHHSFDR